MEQPNLKVCLIQASPVWQDVSANLRHFSLLIEENAASCDLIVLPEMFTTGFSMKPELLAEEAGGKTYKWIAEMARKSGVAILGSIITKEGESYYNRLLFALPDGELKKYDKRHLFRMGNEHNHYSGGTERLIVEYKGWRICPLICYDLRFPVWSRNRNEYDLLIYIASWPAVRSFPWRTLLVARAIENQAYVVGVNRVGEDGEGLKYSGDSVAIGPKGEYIAGITPNEEGICIADLSMPELQSFRAKFPVMLDSDNFEIIS